MLQYFVLLAIADSALESNPDRTPSQSPLPGLVEGQPDAEALPDSVPRRFDRAILGQLGRYRDWDFPMGRLATSLNFPDP